MPKLKNFRIEFDRSVTAFAPGETVSGKVVFCLSAAQQFREIRLKICGKAKVHWEDSNGRYEYSKKEYYFKVLHILAGKKTGNGQTTLLAGEHSYPFSFRLPIKIPCSFKHKYGYIRYTVKAVLDKSWSFDHKTITPFTVLAPYDLTIQQKFATPIHEEIEQEFLEFCCFNAGSMKINVNSRSRLFSPGDIIELLIRHNGSSTRIHATRMRLALLERITFHASSAKKRKKEIIVEVNRIGSFGSTGETSLRLTIPPKPPSNLQYCSIIDINYTLDLIIQFSGTHSNVTRSYPVQLWDHFADSINFHI